MKYLLSGNARCGECGGSLIAVSRSHGKKRAYFYACSSYYKKGSTVCANNFITPMSSADNEVLTKMECDLLRPQAVNAIIDRIVKHYATPPHGTDERRAMLARSIANVEAEQQRLVNAVAAGGEGVSALVDALRRGQERLTALKSELEALAKPRARCTDTKALREAVRQRLAGWRELLRANTAEARRIMAKLLKGRLVFTPKRDGDREFYEFSGEGTIQPVIEGIVPEAITTFGVPSGIRLHGGTASTHPSQFLRAIRGAVVACLRA